MHVRTQTHTIAVTSSRSHGTRFLGAMHAPLFQPHRGGLHCIADSAILNTRLACSYGSHVDLAQPVSVGVCLPPTSRDGAAKVKLQFRQDGRSLRAPVPALSLLEEGKVKG